MRPSCQLPLQREFGATNVQQMFHIPDLSNEDQTNENGDKTARWEFVIIVGWTPGCQLPSLRALFSAQVRARKLPYMHTVEDKPAPRVEQGPFIFEVLYLTSPSPNTALPPRSMTVAPPVSGSTL